MKKLKNKEQRKAEEEKIMKKGKKHKVRMMLKRLKENERLQNN